MMHALFLLGKATSIVIIAIAAMIVIPLLLVILGMFVTTYPIHALILMTIIIVVALILTVLERLQNERR